MSLKFGVEKRKSVLKSHKLAKSSMVHKARVNNLASYCLNALSSSKKAAFTLSEVLVTLGIIGIVAAITMPTLITNVTERVNSERQANIAQKITQAMEQMRAHGLLNTQYASTDAFVDELQKYLKIAKRCDSNHVAECWPTNTVTTADGEEFEVSKAKKGSNLNHKNNKTGNVGLVLADGASLIMTYDENAGGIDIGNPVTAIKKELPVGGGKFKEFPYATSVAGAVDFVMDVNGGKGPNSETINGKYHDIRSFNGAQFAKGMVCDFEAGNLCVKNLDTTYNSVDCSSTSSADYSYCGSVVHRVKSNDYWAGAKKACEAIDGMHLSTRAELDTIYEAKGTVSGVPDSGLFWSSEEKDNLSAFIMSFSNGNKNLTTDKRGQNRALCVGSE